MTRERTQRRCMSEDGEFIVLTPRTPRRGRHTHRSRPTPLAVDSRAHRYAAAATSIACRAR